MQRCRNIRPTFKSRCNKVPLTAGQLQLVYPLWFSHSTHGMYVYSYSDIYNSLYKPRDQSSRSIEKSCKIFGMRELSFLWTTRLWPDIDMHGWSFAKVFHTVSRLCSWHDDVKSAVSLDFRQWDTLVNYTCRPGKTLKLKPVHFVTTFSTRFHMSWDFCLRIDKANNTCYLYFINL